MFLWLKTLYRKRAVTWPFIFYTIIWTLSANLRQNIKLNLPQINGSTIILNQEVVNNLIFLLPDYLWILAFRHPLQLT